MTLMVTIALASLLIILALCFLGISYLLTGKNKIRAGACGRLPKRDEDCGTKTTCGLCKDDDIHKNKS